jgi:hypothetical protein
MLPFLPFEIIALIIDIVGENEDTNLLKELALVSHSFLQICSKHLFATVEIHDAIPIPKHRIASSKEGFIKLLKSRPNVVKYIRNLVCIVMCAITSTTTIIYSHPSFQISSEQFLVSTTSHSIIWTGIHWTLP